MQRESRKVLQSQHINFLTALAFNPKGLEGGENERHMRASGSCTHIGVVFAFEGHFYEGAADTVTGLVGGEERGDAQWRSVDMLNTLKR